MERYSRVGEEESPLDPSLETASMWRLGLRSGGSELYPERPDEPDCNYYLRTGVCGFGSRCRFNHPRNRTPVFGGFRTEAGEFPERIGQPVCQHFIRTGTCKFGVSCKYHHPRQGRGGGGDSDTPISLNYMGFPLRPEEKECSYYMRTGNCKFGPTCRFHHPVVQAPSQQLSADPALPLQSQSVPSLQRYGVAIPPQPQLLPGSYVQSPYGYSQMVLPPGMVPYSGWNQPSMGSSSVYGITPLSASAPAYQSGPSSTGFPQRPEEPECRYFMRTGDCKFGSSCRYNHPLEAVLPKAVSHISLPHSSHTDMHIAPYPLGSSSLSTLASSDQGTELLSSNSTKPKTTSSGSETVAAGVSVSLLEPAETDDCDSVSDVEAKTSS